MTGATLVLFADQWLRIVDGAIVARGDRASAADGALDDNPDNDDARVIAVVPASATILQRLPLAGLTAPQARAAARLAFGDMTAAPIAALHVAVSAEQGGERDAIAIDAALLAASLQALVAAGYDPDAIIPAAVILPPPESGFVCAELGDETVVRGRDAAFVHDPVLTPLIAPVAITTLDRAAVEAAIIAAAANPPIDLRHGPFARQRDWAIGAAQARRIGGLAAILAVMLLAVPLAELDNRSRAARRLEAQTATLSLTALPAGTVLTDPVAQLDARLSAAGAGGDDFLALASVVARAVERSDQVEIGAMEFARGAALRVTVLGTTAAALDALELRLRAAGLTVSATSSAASARPTRELLVRTI